MNSRSLPSNRANLALNMVFRWVRHRELSKAGARLGKGIQTYGRFFEGDPKALSIGDDTRIMPSATLLASGQAGSLSLGPSVYVNRHTVIDSRLSLTIGAGTIIGPNSYISDFDHSLAFNSDGWRIDEGEAAPVSIGRNVWVAANVVILKGVTIGDNSVIGAGAVVSKDIPANSIALGVPARVTRTLNEALDCVVGRTEDNMI
jgi:serine acetyltransferase